MVQTQKNHIKIPNEHDFGWSQDFKTGFIENFGILTFNTVNTNSQNVHFSSKL